MRAAQAEAEKFLQHIRLADERIVIGNEIICGAAVHRLARNGMADVSAAAVHVNAQHAAQNAFVDDLVVVADGIVADGQVKKSVLRVKKHSAAVMPDGLVGLVNENNFRAGNGNAVFIKRETRKPVVVGVRQDRIRARERIADDRAGLDPGVIDENEMVRRKARMKRDAEQAGIVPALALVVDVEREFFLRRARIIFKRPHAALAFPDAKFIRARHGCQADRIGENQIGERNDRRPVSRNAGRDFRHRAVEKRADSGRESSP